MNKAGKIIDEKVIQAYDFSIKLCKLRVMFHNTHFSADNHGY